MAKKPRSQRRKKGTSMGDNGGGSGGTSAESSFDVDVLSESHTIANSDDMTFDDSMWDDGLSGGGGYDNDDDDLDQNNSVQSTQAAAEARHMKLLDVLNMVDDIPSEKRSAKRESSLRSLYRSLTQHATGMAGSDAVLSKLDEIFAACKYSIRVGSPSEQYASCRVLEATSIVLGPDTTFYDTIYTMLWRVCQSKIKAVPVRIAAIRALSMSNFIGSNDDVSTENLLDNLELVAAKEYRNEAVPTNLRAAALDCWALLSTTIEDLYIAGKDDVSTGRGLILLSLLQECLDDSNVQLRSAAGECVALIHEARLNLGIMNSDQNTNDGGDNTTKNTTERQFRRGTWEGSEWEETFDEIQQRISELSVESGHHMSKKAKKEQRATFREFQATIVDDETPEEVVNFRGGTLELSTWSEIIQLNFIRHCLQSGFQIQLLTNSTLQTIFGANGRMLNEFGGYSQLEKRLLLSKTSDAAKAADIDLTRKRRTRNNIKNHFLTADGEDI